MINYYYSYRGSTLNGICVIILINYIKASYKNKV